MPRSPLAISIPEDRQWNHLIEVELEETCSPCNGEGEIANFEDHTFTTCSECAGDGVVLTDIGSGILELVARHRDYEPI